MSGSSMQSWLRRRRCASSLLLLVALSVAGCQRGPSLYSVSGEVSYEGQPVEQGQILFVDPEGVAPAASGVIQDGHYEVQTLAGEKQVRITATRETGKMIEGAMGATYPETVDLIPPQYNSATTLQRTIEPTGGQTLDFSLD